VSAKFLGLLYCLCFFCDVVAQPVPVVVGSKNFTEGYLLAEIMAQLLESRGFPVERQFGFGGTLVAFAALRAGEIDVYAEYSGTISQAILAAETTQSNDEIAAALEVFDLEPLPTLGFNNTYAIAVTENKAEQFGLSRISDLQPHQELRVGLSHEFRDRPDGWPGVKARYGLSQDSLGIEHGLAYQALLEDEIDVTDAYSTDGDLLRYGLVVLEDDLGFFPSYHALPLVRRNLDPEAKATLRELANRLDDNSMRALNASVVVEEQSFAEVASSFLLAQGLISAAEERTNDIWYRLQRNTLVHLKLTGIALLAACIGGLGLALLVYRSRAMSSTVLYVAGLLQTIPSIALLALMIPIAGVGQLPAIIALFLYSLLPITRNSITALITIDPLLRRVATALGLSHREQLTQIFIPIALPHILAGIRIAAVMSIGTATLAAFIGAGGLGEPIVTGLALNDTNLILQGAIPAALLALITELVFEMLERWLVPRHLLSGQTTS
jgi:osmoprotectant transport system permease protein